MEAFYLYFNGNIYRRSDSLPGIVRADVICGYDSKGDALMDLYECQKLISKNSIGMPDEYIDEQRKLLDSIEVLSSSDMRVSSVIASMKE